jgi:hypothetical protein
MYRLLFTLLGVLFLGVVALFGHYFSYDKECDYEALVQLSALSHVKTPVWEGGYTQPHSLFRPTPLNPAYPEMLELNRVDFVYEK